MATIALLIEHEEGHLNPTFRLARRLAARGHRLVYLGLPDGGDFVRRQGFEFVPILEDLFPRGTVRTLREMARTGGRADGAARQAEIGVAAQAGPGSTYARSWRGLLADETLDRTMQELRPDLFVLTSSYVPHAVVLRNRYRLPIVILTTFLRTFAKSEYAADLGRLLMYSGEAKERLASLLTGAGPASRRAAELAPRLLAQVLRMRELILCPQDLELPGRSHEREPEVHYVEPTVDLERRNEGAFPWEALDPSRRLLYVSLGSQSYRAGRDRAVAFLRGAAEAFARRPEWQVVLSTGGLLDPAELPAPPGGIVTGWAPQLKLLARTSVMVTHAGLGTVKECILCGVPMVVVPIDTDQPENARRVVHHGLGVQADLESSSPGAIASLVEQAGQPAVREDVERMRQRFLAIESSGIGVALIEELLGTGGSAIATIGLLIEHEEGHLNPTFRLARRLAARGHRPVYLGLPDGGDFVRRQGFEFVPILEDLFPQGTVRTLREMARAGEAGEGRAAEIAAAAQAGPGSVYARSWRGILEDEASDRTIRELRPDLFVLTSFYAPHAVVLRNRYRLPIVLLTPILRTFPKSGYAAELSRLLMSSEEAKQRLAALLTGSGPARRAAELAPRILAQVLRMRELILCPRDLEVPGASPEREPEVHYVEPNVDLERHTESGFPWEALDPGRHLLYVSLGSQSYRVGRERVAGFLRAVTEAFANRPGWQVVISTGSLLDPDEVPAPPAGIVTAWAPQVELLQRASVAVTHAGLGTIKECILCGVPLVAFPFPINDQPDNARRVVHHGLGVSGDLRSVSAAAVAALVEQADRPAVRSNVARMRQCFLDAERSGISVLLIEELLAPPADRGPG